ncbi:glycosyltransferase [Nonomuraea sp. NPDC005650]|uniref:glycosyltransferase n=1 Tax=Nonomuraea sp. NPDC005650 TaxID=3157045 RepID=UPI0033B1CCE2
MRVSVGIFAHNEEGTIGEVIDAFLGQRTETSEIAEVIVVCCACTDRTLDIVKKVARADVRVRVLERERREGKVAAINAFLAVARSEVVIVSGGDVIPEPHLVERLVHPIQADSRCAMTGAKVVSRVGKRTVTAMLHKMLWHLHHEVARIAPKLGETVALRRSMLPERLPPGVHCDEVLMESLVVSCGGTLAYVTGATVYNHPPRRLAGLYGQRRRIACQHANAYSLLRYRPATARLRNIVAAVAVIVCRDSRSWLWLIGLAILEAIAKFHGHLDFRLGHRYRVWRPAGR